MKRLMWLLLSGLCLPVGGSAVAPREDAAQIEQLPGGGYRCVTSAYQARLDKNGNLQSLTTGGTEFLGRAGTNDCGLAFLHAGQAVPFRTVTRTAPDTLVAEGEPRPLPATAPKTEHPVLTRAVYQFLPDRITITLEQHLDPYGYFGWFPSSSVTASYDAQNDNALRLDQPLRYHQMDPRWVTKDGPILRFDFGVWQKGFANAQWAEIVAGGKKSRYVANIIPTANPITMTAFPLAHPTAPEALAFDVTAASPDFDLPGGTPVHFAITATNAGPDPVAATVRFAIRDYLTKRTIGTRATRVSLAAKQSRLLPTDLPLKEPGPYRALIEVLDGKTVARTVEWVFSYDFAHYDPPTTRPADFAAFWKQALTESAALPLGIKKTLVPGKSTPTINAYKINFATLGSRRIYGWYTSPKAPGKYPARVRYPSSGIYPLDNPEIIEGVCTLWIAITGFDVDLANMPKSDDPGKNYWTAGLESPQTSLWRTIYVSLVRAVDVVLAQPEVDPKRIIVHGGSQGGGLAMVAAGLDHRVGLCIPMYSGLARLDWTVRYAPGYWPFSMTAKPKDQTEDQFLHTLSYFDAANFTPDIRCPVLAEVGLMDTVTASGNQLAALAHVPRSRLYLVCAPWGGHATGSRDGDHIGEYCDRFLKGVSPVIPAPVPPAK